jgi:hypothetical protein
MFNGEIFRLQTEFRESGNEMDLNGQWIVKGLKAALTRTRVDRPRRRSVWSAGRWDSPQASGRVLAIDVKGNLAAMLTAAVPADWDRHAALVAGLAAAYTDRPLRRGGMTAIRPQHQ